MKKVYIVFESNGVESVIKGVFEKQESAYEFCGKMRDEEGYPGYYTECHDVI